MRRSLRRRPSEIRVEFGGVTVARTNRAWRVLETSHPPVYYVPPEDLARECIVPAFGSSFCEWKGTAEYVDVLVRGRRYARAGWTYGNPSRAFAAIAGHVAFYPGVADGAYVDGERVRPQPGSFYGGWITDAIVGPFKGEPGTAGW